MKKFPFEKLPHWLQTLIRPDVIKAMQIKFVAMAMGILIGVFIVMLTAINMIMKTVSQTQSMQLLENIAKSERYDVLNDAERPGEFPPPEDMPPKDNMPPPEMETIQSAEEEAFNVQMLSLTLEKRPDEKWRKDDDEYKEWYEEWRRQNPDIPPQWDDDDWDDDDYEEWYEDWRKQNPDVPPWWDEHDFEIPPTEQIQPPLETQQIPADTAPVLTQPPQEEAPVNADPVPPPEEQPPEQMPENPELPPEELTETEPSETNEVLTETEALMTETLESETASESESDSATESETQETPPPKPDDENQNPPDGFRMDRAFGRGKLNIILDHFALMADEEGNFLGIRNTENYTDVQAETILTGILNSGKQQGMYGWLQYYKAEKEYGTLVVVTDKTSDQGILDNLFRTTVIAGIIVLLVLFIFLIFFSRWIVQPVRTSMERQKQFVSDASHELKTPIAVLTANVDILQDEIGENKWLDYIQEQTTRMNQLVGDLLRLARMDNAKQEYVFKEFNLSTAIEATALPFESQAFEKQKNLEIDIQPDVMYTGSEQHIRQLAAIFIDNAMKYSNAHGTIKISLLRRGEKCILEFYNTGCEISQEETDKIFERFYRGDKARNNKGKNGYGLGLAIAKSIMEIHKIKIQVTCEQGAWIRFLMTM